MSHIQASIYSSDRCRPSFQDVLFKRGFKLRNIFFIIIALYSKISRMLEFFCKLFFRKDNASLPTRAAILSISSTDHGIVFI